MVMEMATVSVDLDDVAVVVVAEVDDLKVISNARIDQTTNEMARMKSQIQIARRDVGAIREVAAAADVMTVDAVAVDKVVNKVTADKVTADAARDRDGQGRIGMIDKKARADVDVDLLIVTGMIDPKHVRTSQK
tara:strand:+ start:12884 stop:13285 length:402 start_codon:yes stop_codon:yes gene_type:complete